MDPHVYPVYRSIALQPFGAIGLVGCARVQRESQPASALPGGSVSRAVAAAKHKNRCATPDTSGIVRSEETDTVTPPSAHTGQ